MISTKWLEIKNTDIYYSEESIFNNLNLSLDTDQHTVLIGSNGSGKSTLIKTITKLKYPLYKKNSYIKIFNSEKNTIWELRSKIGFVCTEIDKRIKSEMKTRDIILSGLQGTFGLINNQKLIPEHLELLEEVTEKLNICKLNKYYSELSDGQKRTVLIARSIINKPIILLLDEPTTMLDIKAKYILLNILRKLANEGITLFYTTNNIESIIPETNRVILLKSGKIIADGKPTEVMTQSNISNLYDYNLNLINQNGYWNAFPR